jgi:HNH endonuclease
MSKAFAERRPSGASRPELNRAAWQRIRKLVRERDGNCCPGCGASGEWAKLSVHHLLPASLGGTDDMANLVTVCSDCHSRYEQAARTLTLPVETPPARARTAGERRTGISSFHERYADHPAPFRSPEGLPWSRQWYEY